MDAKVRIGLAALVVVIVAVVAVLAVGSLGNEETEASPFGARVYLDDGSETYTESAGTGMSVKDVIQDALVEHNVTFASNGNITSVDEVYNDGDRRWVVFRWASPGGWTPVSDTKTAMHDGVSLTVRYSDRVKDEQGNVTYSTPDIQVKYKVYYFIQIREQWDATSWLRELPLTESQKRTGFWISGEGTTNNEALADAMLKTFYPGSKYKINSGDNDEGNYIEYSIEGKDKEGELPFFRYGTKIDMYGWFLSFMGWSDTKVSSKGEYGTWTFWTQFSYNPNAKTDDDTVYWDFNQWSFGMYDISRYHYFALVLKTSEMEDTYIDLPTPSEIPEGL